MRIPLPLFSASDPSGLKIRSAAASQEPAPVRESDRDPDRDPDGARAHVQQDPVRPDTMVPVADAANHRPIGTLPEGIPREHHIVVSKRVILPELHDR